MVMILDPVYTMPVRNEYGMNEYRVGLASTRYRHSQHFTFSWDRLQPEDFYFQDAPEHHIKYFNPFTFWRNLAILGTFFKVKFYEKYTSNEAQAKLKTLFKA